MGWQIWRFVRFFNNNIKFRPYCCCFVSLYYNDRWGSYELCPSYHKNLQRRTKGYLRIIECRKMLITIVEIFYITLRRLFSTGSLEEFLKPISLMEDILFICLFVFFLCSSILYQFRLHFHRQFNNDSYIRCRHFYRISNIHMYKSHRFTNYTTELFQRVTLFCLFVCFFIK